MKKIKTKGDNQHLLKEVYYDNEVGIFSSQTELEKVKNENKYYDFIEQAKGVLI